MTGRRAVAISGSPTTLSRYFGSAGGRIPITKPMTAAVATARPEPIPSPPDLRVDGHCMNCAGGAYLDDLAHSKMRAGNARKVRCRTIGWFPARTERIDFTTPCRKCGNAPTCMVKLGPVVIERTFHTCGASSSSMRRLSGATGREILVGVVYVGQFRTLPPSFRPQGVGLGRDRQAEHFGLGQRLPSGVSKRRRCSIRVSGATRRSRRSGAPDSAGGRCRRV